MIGSYVVDDTKSTDRALRGIEGTRRSPIGGLVGQTQSKRLGASAASAMLSNQLSLSYSSSWRDKKMNLIQ
jgi:hypothetical protein